MQLPAAFKETISNQLGPEAFQDFFTSLGEEIPVSVRTNPRKSTSLFQEAPVAWCKYGYYLNQRPVFTLDPMFHAGAYYVQEASSMFIWHILENICKENKEVRILDLSAAPGGKSTLIAAFLNNNGLLVANEVIKNRAYTLKYNLSKEGYSNVVVTNNDPKDFLPLEKIFDIILVDAPCSGEGMFRKDPNAILEWSPENVVACSIRQQRILTDIVGSLKDGGHLIYSTCTFNAQENIDNVAHAIETFGMESVSLPMDPNWQITTVQKGNAIGYQFYPHKTKGEGLFAAVLQKTTSSLNVPKWKSNAQVLMSVDKKNTAEITSWVNLDNHDLLIDKTGNIHSFPIDKTEIARVISQYLKIIYCGTTVGLLNKTVFIPDHSLALSLDRSENVPTVDLNKEEALLFLKKELNAVESSHKSWVLATYNGLGIGWLKNLGHRINNYLPAEYRILMKIN